MLEHLEHEWEEVPPCVYCIPCRCRLYQGELPPGRADKEQMVNSLDSLFTRLEEDDVSV